MPPARIALWVASAGGIALLARTLLIGPVPTWFAVIAFVAYATYCTLGVIVPAYNHPNSFANGRVCNASRLRIERHPAGQLARNIFWNDATKPRDWVS